MAVAFHRIRLQLALACRAKVYTYVVNAGPNLTRQFTPEPKYYIVAADEVVEGQVMDITTVTKSGSLVFPPNVYDLTATLKADNQWDIKPSN